MDKQEIQALSERIRAVLPAKAEVEIVPTQNRSLKPRFFLPTGAEGEIVSAQQDDVVYLVIVKLSPETVLSLYQVDDDDKWLGVLSPFFERCPDLRALYFWESQKVHQLHYKKVVPVLGEAERFRSIYCCDSKFALYTQKSLPFFGGERCPREVDFLGMRDGEHYRYVGRWKSIDVLIGFLMEDRGSW
ncbi:MAG: hypothetical protein IKS23_02975 [Alphaproteobacteria bacterium]|nr:hypothetical protein [Alphaproteobacteria bacterium]